MDNFIENIEFKRKVIVDYEFMSFLIKKANKDDVNALNFIEFISNQEVDVYDFLGNEFDIRALQYMQDEIEIIKKETVAPDLSIANCFTILAFKDNIKANLLVLTTKNFKNTWNTLYNCKTVLINKGEKHDSINDFWEKILKNYTNINYNFLIVQEPFYNSINTTSKNGRLNNKGENINILINYIINNDSNILILVDSNKSRLNNLDPNIQKIKKIDSKKHIHDRFFLTNYFFFRSGNSFDYFGTDKKEVQLSTSLVVTSIVNDFSSFINFKKYYKNNNN